MNLAGQIINNIHVIRQATPEEVKKHCNQSRRYWVCECPHCHRTDWMLRTDKLTGDNPVKMCDNCNRKYVVGHFQNLVNQTFGKLTVIKELPERTKSGRIRYLCQCTCGNTTIVQANHLLHHKITSCGCGVRSIGEQLISEYLHKHNISYIPQFKHPECVDKYVLAFDFYLPDLQIVIEYHGKQHFQPIDFFGGLSNFEIGVAHDLAKEDFCERNDIRYYAIAYYEDVEQKLKAILPI